MATVVHPSAFVDPSAELGEGVVVGPCAVIEKSVIIGNDCRIDAFASVKEFTRMGERNHVHSYAHVGGVPQDLKFHGEESWLIIGNDNNIREFSSMHRGTEGGGGRTVVGDHNLFMAYTHVAHDCHVGSHVVMSNCATLAGHVEVADYAILGGLSAVHQFTRVGTGSFLGGTSSISQDLPPFMLAVGNRGGVHAPNLVGLRRHHASAEAIAGLKKAYKLIWQSDMPRKEALEVLMTEYGGHREIQLFIEFVNSSQRGILPAAQENIQA